MKMNLSLLFPAERAVLRSLDQKPISNIGRYKHCKSWNKGLKGLKYHLMHGKGK